MPSGNPYPTMAHVLKRHGPLVVALWYTTEAASWLSIGHWLRWLPRRIRFLAFAYNAAADKVKPWWQDAVAMLLLAATALPFYLVDGKAASAAVAAYLIFDAAIYHIRALWFDDLTPWILSKRREVWSHRRILFLSLLHYLQSMLLFIPIYACVLATSLAKAPHLFKRSFATATLMSLGHPLTGADMAQVAVSLFYLAVVVSTMASVAYRRPETGDER